MSLAEILGISGGGLLIILTLIQISPLKINPWSWLAKQIGKAINSDVLTELREVKEDQEELTRKLERHIEDDEERDANYHRARILRFNIGLMRGEEYTHEYFTDMLAEIDEYERYCNTHPDYKNNRAVIAVENIKRAYEDHVRDGDFLGGV